MMTTKQIAEAVSRPEKTVRDWVLRIANPTKKQIDKFGKDVVAKSAAIKAKSATSSPMVPADYDLEETVAIIEVGLGKNVVKH